MWPRRIFCLIVLAGWTLAVHAATPPALVNYQGVLRDNNDKPLTGTFDMTFGFYDAQNAGNQILLDAHTGAGAVGVSGGQFNVQLGSGAVSDGSGPGTYTALDQVFRDYPAVWMEIVVGVETLTPRIRVVGAPYALNASNLEGKNAASFIDTSATSQTKAGHLTVNNGIDASTGSGFGINANGGQAGGAFGAGGAFAYVADTGVINTGIRAQGNDAGGWFVNNATGSKAYCGYGNEGLEAHGTNIGGHFSDNSGNEAFLASDRTTRRLGIEAFGQDTGGNFYNNSGAGVCNLADGGWGIRAYGQFCGIGCGGAGLFQDSKGLALAYLGYSDTAIETHASGSGGSFYNTNGIATAVATNGFYGLSSNGTKSFLQNHPEDPNSVIAYTALEGDEAGTYTRGTARLVNGEARIPLGETFKWVTNPDIGLTAHLTPVGEWADLYVASKSTKELVVRSRDPHAPDTAFDYVVFGLREGFESIPVVREKEHEMPIPAGTSGESVFAKRPELQRFTALSRFSQMQKALASTDTPLDLSASQSLKAKIHVFDSERDGDSFRAPAPTPAAGLPAHASPPFPGAAGPAPPGPAAPAGASTSGAGVAASGPSFPPNSCVAEIGASAETGELLANDAARPGLLKSADQPGDPGVVGIVAGEAGATWKDRAPIALSGTIVLCKVDASYGPIQPNDLLVTSPTPGHAMRAGDNPRQGTVVAKALETFEAGTGTIRVLAMSR